MKTKEEVRQLLDRHEMFDYIRDDETAIVVDHDTSEVLIVVSEESVKADHEVHLGPLDWTEHTNGRERIFACVAQVTHELATHIADFGLEHNLDSN